MLKVKIAITLITAMIVIFTSNALAAEFHSSLNKNTIDLNQTVNLKIELTDANSKEAPDLSVIKQNFIIIATSDATSIEIINGKSSSARKWILTLKPKQSGRFIIPPLTIKTNVGKLSSKELIITVNTASISSHTKGNNITVKSKISNENPYLNEPIIYTIQLITATELKDLKFPELAISDAIINVPSPPVVYDSKQNGYPVKIIEFTYIITPIKAGEIVIPSEPIQGMMISAGKRQKEFTGIFDSPFDDEPDSGATGFEYFEVAAKKVKFSVKPTVKNITPWLPAKFMNISSTLGSNIFTVGKPFKFTVITTSNGLLKNQLPSTKTEELKGKGYKIYAENTISEEKIDENGELVSIKEEIYTIVPQISGKITLPKLQLKWWDTVNNKEAITTVDAYTIDVSSGNTSFNLVKEDNSSNSSQNEEKTQDRQKQPENEEKKLQDGVLTKIANSQWFYYLVASCIVILGIILGFKFIFTRPRILNKQYNTHKAKHSVLLASSSELSPSQVTVPQETSLIKIKEADSAVKLYKFLQVYANKHFGINLNSSLQDIFSIIEEYNPHITKMDYVHILKQLEDSLYANKEINMQKLQQECENYLKMAYNKKSITRKDKQDKNLPDLNPLEL